MATTCNATICSRTTYDRNKENEVVLDAIKNCDDDVYQAIISVLTEAGLLHE